MRSVCRDVGNSGFVGLSSKTGSEMRQTPANDMIVTESNTVVTADLLMITAMSHIL